jgi:flavin reductase (DIM6/NTAB) family NADH-FMN oxidoreductase RutF
MDFDFDSMTAQDRYKILISTVLPRPIAWVTSLSPDGAPNAAPYSFFNVMGHDPAILVIGVQRHPEGRFKDTSANILATGEFVVNLVSRDTLEAMNITCIDAPPEVDELQLAGLETSPSVKVAPPRIAASPVAFECRLHTSLSFGPQQAMIVARVVHAHVQDDMVLDATRRHVDVERLHLVGRTHGSDWYIDVKDPYQLPRPTWAKWTGKPGS